ncbi:hypothetical protein VPJ68_06365, partial [Parabacteroides distasonis]
TSGINAGEYEAYLYDQGAGNVTPLGEGGEIPEGAALVNRLKNEKTVTVRAEVEWAADAFDLAGVEVTLQLQQRPKNAAGEDYVWTDSAPLDENNQPVPIQCTLTGFDENALQSEEMQVGQYNSRGQELEYRWVQIAVKKDGKEIARSTDTDGIAKFYLTE